MTEGVTNGAQALATLRSLYKRSSSEQDKRNIAALGAWVKELGPGGSLSEARQKFYSKLEDGGMDCPCCDRLGKVYRRRIHAAMSVGLIRLYRRGTDWVKIVTIIPEHNFQADFTKLRFWGLIEAMDGRTATENATGHWRITEKGALFAKGYLSVPAYAAIYDNRLLRLEGEPVDVREALGTKFDYAELMGEGGA